MRVVSRVPFLVAAILGVGADWPQFLGPQRNGVSAETGLLQTWPANGPSLVWDRKVGAGFSGPVVAGGKLILFHRIDDEEVVECLQADSGKPIWKSSYPTAYVDDFGFDEGPRSTPLIAGNHVFTLGAEGKLTCFDLESGKQLWQRNLNKDYGVRKGFFGVGTSPILEGDRLLINVGGKGAGIVAFDRETGRELWKTLDHEASYSSPTAATIAGDRHVIFLTREGIVSLNPKDGAEHFSRHWRARLHASVNAATPLVVDDLVFASACYNVGGIVLHVKRDGITELWRSDDVMSCHYNTPIIRDGYLYGVDGRQEGGAARLRCVDLKTGKVRWTQDRFGCASMIWADGNLVALTEKGDLVLIEATPEAYREKSRAAVMKGPPCRSEIALADGHLYARDGQRLACFRLQK